MACPTRQLLTFFFPQCRAQMNMVAKELRTYPSAAKVQCCSQSQVPSCGCCESSSLCPYLVSVANIFGILIPVGRSTARSISTI